jgi:hypothetical protein
VAMASTSPLRASISTAEVPSSILPRIAFCNSESTLICTSWPGMPSRRSSSRMTRPTALTSSCTAPARPRRMRSWWRSTRRGRRGCRAVAAAGRRPCRLRRRRRHSPRHAPGARPRGRCAWCRCRPDAGQVGRVHLDPRHLLPGQELAHDDGHEAAAAAHLALDARALMVGRAGRCFEKVSSVAPTSAVCSATSRARQFSRLPATTLPVAVEHAPARRGEQPGRDAVLLGQRRVALALPRPAACAAACRGSRRRRAAPRRAAARGG